MKRSRRQQLGRLTKRERIELRKTQIGSKQDRKLRKYSNNFNEMFEFFFKIHRSGLVNFCGSIVNVDFDINASDGKFAFREYDNGRFKFVNPVTRHPNILKSVICGKKGWGLWLNTWCEGIVEWSFTKEEILNEFEIRGITIPKPLMDDFENRLETMKYKRNQKYLEILKKN